MNKTKLRRWLLAFALIFLAVAVKYIYLRTAERLVDIEELPIDPLNLVTGHRAGDDFGSTRLYSFTYITNAIFLYIFGFKIASLKFTSLAFFALSCWGVWKTACDWFEGRPAWVKWLPFCLIAFGPPVAQMWALKNRGGFIETWAILAWVLWVYGRWQREPKNEGYIFALGALCGLALWAQPIALVFVMPLFAGVVWQSLKEDWRTAFATVGKLSASTLLGVMPLIALNFLFNFRTFTVLDSGEHGVGANTPLERLVRLFLQGLPRLSGLKQQWLESWVFPTPIALLFFVVLVLFSLAVLLSVARRFWRERTFDSRVLAAATVLLILIANTFSSWGSFQGEPRRLLLIYVPMALLMVWVLHAYKRALLVFVTVWFGVSLFSNVAYIRANPRGFVHPMYSSYKGVTEFLQSRGIDNIYAGVWVRAKIQFESHMQIDAQANPYVEPVASRPHSENFDYRSAALFHDPEVGQMGAFGRMLADAGALGISCLTEIRGSFRIVYGCSREFNVYKLGRKADQLRTFEAAGVIFDHSKYNGRSLDGFYDVEKAYVWTKPRLTIPFIQGAPRRGYICIRYAALRPANDLTVALGLDGRAIEVAPISGRNLNYAVSLQAIDIAPGPHRLNVGVPYFMPSRNSHSMDLRSLGLPLVSISVVPNSDACTSH